MKNHLSKQKLVIAYTGTKDVLAKSFVKSFYKDFIFKPYSGDITNHIKIETWLKKNIDINIFINFAAIISSERCEKNKKNIF